MTDNACNSREERETFSENNTKNHLACKTHADICYELYTCRSLSLAPLKNGSQICSLSSYILFLFNSDLIERTKFISSLSRYVVVLNVSTNIIIKTGA